MPLSSNCFLFFGLDGGSLKMCGCSANFLSPTRLFPHVTYYPAATSALLDVLFLSSLFNISLLLLSLQLPTSSPFSPAPDVVHAYPLIILPSQLYHQI
jgi:hypothetical protein